MPPNLDALTAALAERYQIERELGMGGMATVYLAQDLKHDRKVAVKVLKPELAAVLGAERFVVEIKTTASLQHPHILPLFDSGTAGGFLYYVMPFIEGETLRDKLNRETQLGIDEAVRIARDVADALDYAHRHGVIHRDIKPENILLHDGRPMVADFGIALAVSAAAGGRMTETGLSLGTPHYMSPEQATAEKEITARADVYSLASVLYEMLAGEPPHMGNSAQQIIMKIIAEPVQPVTKLRKSVPPNVAAALIKALEKLPADRFESARAFANALSDPSFTTATLATPQSVRARSRAFAALAAACVLFIGIAAWGWFRSIPVPPVVRYTMPGAAAGAPIEIPVPTPSPDGSFLVFHAPVDSTGTSWQLWLKRRDQHTATPISGTRGALTFALSPDNEWIVFAEGVQLKKVQVSGGSLVTLVATGVDGSTGVAWLDDNTIVYPKASRSRPRLMKIAAAGGEPTPLWENDSLATAVPEAIAGHHAVLFSRCASPFVCDLWAMNLATGKARSVLPGVYLAQYAATGHIVFVRDGRLRAVPFDAGTLETRGDPVSIADSISGTTFPLRLSRSGVLVTRVGARLRAGQHEMVWVDRRGVVTRVDTTWRFRNTANAANHGWALSRDGKRLAIGLNTDAGDDIWVKELPRGPLSRISFDAAAEQRPRWSPDDRSITFISNRAVPGMYQRRADGAGNDSLLYRGEIDEAVLTPDNMSVLIRVGANEISAGGRAIHRIRLGDTARMPVVVTPFDEDAIALSPDAKWIAYQSDETGRNEVFVRSYPNTDAFKRQVSNGGGAAPLWSRDGRELFYLSEARSMMAARVSAASATSLSLAEPVALFRVPDELLNVEFVFYTPWDIAPDGRFIMARSIGANLGQAGTVVVAENWLQELSAKMKR